MSIKALVLGRPPLVTTVPWLSFLLGERPAATLERQVADAHGPDKVVLTRENAEGGGSCSVLPHLARLCYVH